MSMLRLYGKEKAKRYLKLLIALLILCGYAQMAKAQGLPSPIPCPQFFSTTGTPLAGGFLYSYVSGTLTPQATYTDFTMTLANSNPITLNAAGQPVSVTGSCGVFLNPAQIYRFILQNSSGVQQWLVDGISSPNGSLLLGQVNTWTSLQTFSGGITVTGSATYSGGIAAGTGAPAYQSGTGGPPIPTLWTVEEGTSSSGVTSRNLNTPETYISRWDSSNNSLCQSGLLDACSAPVARIDFTNGNTGTTDTPIGLLINGWGIQGLTPLNGAGGTVVGLGIALFDVASETGNTDYFGINSNLTVQGVPSGLDRAGFTRAVFSSQLDITNSSGSDCQFLATTGSGNYCGGNSIFAAGANNSTAGFVIGSVASAGVGFLTGLDLSGVKNVGSAIYQANSLSTTSGFLAANGGAYGFVGGGLSVNPAHNATEAIASPTIAFLADVATSSAFNSSLPTVWRAYNGDTSHINEWKAYQINANNSWRLAFGSNCTSFPCPSYTDQMMVDSSGDVEVLGKLIFGIASIGGTNGGYITGTFTGQRVFTFPDQSATVAVMGFNGISSGSITLSGGSGSHNFTTPYTSAPNCTATDGTGANAVKITSSTTAVSVTGTSSDVVTWICVPTAN